MSESIHEKLERVRKPRVHIKYEVETEGAVIQKELSFIIGVLGDFSGDSCEPLKPLRERKFVQIDRDNFDDVMNRLNPGLKFKIANTLKNDDSELAIELQFNSLKDFEPANIAQQVPALKKLLDTRNKLRDLLSKVDRSENLENILERILQDNAEIQLISQQLKLDSTSTVNEE